MTSTGAQAINTSQDPDISADGRYVAFWSSTPDLVQGVSTHIYVHDRRTGVTSAAAVDSSGGSAFGDSRDASISSDGRYVVFASNSTTLVPGDTNGAWDVFVRDRQTGTTVRASVDSNGVEGNGDSYVFLIDRVNHDISDDGRFVAFASHASNLVPGDTQGAEGFSDIFVRDMHLGLTTRVSVSSAGVAGNDISFSPAISGDGRYVAFKSWASNLVTGASNSVFVHDRQTGTTTLVGNGHYPAISADGRKVAYFSSDTALMTLKDLQSGTIVTVPTINGALGVALGGVSVSGDGRFVSFASTFNNFVANDTNSVSDVFVRDVVAGKTTRMSVGAGGAEGNMAANLGVVSRDGRFTVFASKATNLVVGDTNHEEDIFVRGPHLTLEVTPAAVATNDVIELATWGGKPLAGVGLFLTGINGTPILQLVIPGAFDGHGEWVLPAVVPAGLAGNVLTFQAIGYPPSGPVELSNHVPIAFQ